MKEKETVEVDKDLYSTLRCLTIALMDKYCPNGEFILTREHRQKLVSRLSINAYCETLDNLDDRYWIE
jgi:hypothetical protein